jgi:hypothetical protein
VRGEREIEVAQVAGEVGAELLRRLAERCRIAPPAGAGGGVHVDRGERVAVAREEQLADRRVDGVVQGHRAHNARAALVVTST